MVEHSDSFPPYNVMRLARSWAVLRHCAKGETAFVPESIAQRIGHRQCTEGFSARTLGTCAHSVLDLSYNHAILTTSVFMELQFPMLTVDLYKDEPNKKTFSCNCHHLSCQKYSYDFWFVTMISHALAVQFYKHAMHVTTAPYEKWTGGYGFALSVSWLCHLFLVNSVTR